MTPVERAAQVIHDALGHSRASRTMAETAAQALSDAGMLVAPYWTDDQAWKAGEAAFGAVRRLDRQNGRLSSSFRESDLHVAGREIIRKLGGRFIGDLLPSPPEDTTLPG